MPQNAATAYVGEIMPQNVKKYFKILGKKIMFYYMPKKSKPIPPSKRYLNLIIKGYRDCGYRNNYIIISKNKKIKVR